MPTWFPSICRENLVWSAVESRTGDFRWQELRLKGGFSMAGTETEAVGRDSEALDTAPYRSLQEGLSLCVQMQWRCACMQ